VEFPLQKDRKQHPRQPSSTKQRESSGLQHLREQEQGQEGRGLCVSLRVYHYVFITTCVSLWLTCSSRVVVASIPEALAAKHRVGGVGGRVVSEEGLDPVARVGCGVGRGVDFGHGRPIGGGGLRRVWERCMKRGWVRALRGGEGLAG
jgi:hypothetical protein